MLCGLKLYTVTVVTYTSAISNRTRLGRFCSNFCRVFFIHIRYISYSNFCLKRTSVCCLVIGLLSSDNHKIELVKETDTNVVFATSISRVGWFMKSHN
jgi:hypothetical protein